ncbi:winged helix-turn-helix domain-containing protein [Arenimonas fontis]|uniref:OmpR/PhoB-type domain-containing protein n=1 Tax=Arenimonas fontis TaxID=2608255 RepID=A0A5B2ZC26_9GAMM|nr:winged helix-turn-helix domain-containing protein [Arenimonas fontis]KAA2285093.1 hypothetical protein F0415_07575 [Arenimonas fontis]
MSVPPGQGELPLASAGPDTFRFGEFELSLPRRLLLRAGEPVELQPKVFECIAFLLLNRGRVVDKTELLDAVWPRQVVTEAALSRCVMKARRALDDEAENPKVILTVHARGYRFIAPVEPVLDRRSRDRAGATETGGATLSDPLPATGRETEPTAPVPADAAAPDGGPASSVTPAPSTPGPAAEGAAPSRRARLAWAIGLPLALLAALLATRALI